LLQFHFIMKKNKKNVTRKIKHPKPVIRYIMPTPTKAYEISGKIIEEKEGWKVIHIYGESYERGFAHGSLLSDELQRIKDAMAFYIQDQIHVSLATYFQKSEKVIAPILKKKFPEYYREIDGISDGAKSKGVDVSIEFLIGWNSFMSLYDLFLTGPKLKDKNQRCSAFIATGDATENGDIVMAHNTHTDFFTGQLFNIILKITPMVGHEFIMQTMPGCIASCSDWYISKSGIVCCETTIADINYKPVFGVPYFCRIREAIQHGNSLDQCSKIMLKENAGDYACSWLFGDLHTGEIMLLELGLKEHNMQKKKNGVFYGMNSAIGEKLRKTETNDVEFYDISSRCGMRNFRLNQLLNEEYYGKINVNSAKKIIGDHYDILLKKDSMNQRVICKHPELDPDAGYKPYSSTDAKVVDSAMAKDLHFWGIFGSGCGKRNFNVKKYVKEHPEYKLWGNVLENMPNRKWTKL